MGRNLVGAVAAVTGGARGIGLAVADLMARAGVHVVLGDIDADLARSRGEALGGLGLPLDVRDEASFSSFIAGTHDRFGRLDILVNSAGVIVPGDFLSTTAAQQEIQFLVNFGGTLRGLRLALPRMVQQNSGHIINIASAAGRIPAPGSAVYTASKHAVIGLTEAVRVELRHTGVRLTAILPTAADTEMSAGLRMRGIPKTDPELIACAVLRVLQQRRPAATLMVPRWLGAAALVDAAAPQWLGDLARRLLIVEPVSTSAGPTPYEQRLLRQFGGIGRRPDAYNVPTPRQRNSSSSSAEEERKHRS